MALKRLWEFEDYHKWLHHEEPFVREWAADALLYQYPCRCREALVELLDNPEDRDWVWIRAFAALIEDPDPSKEAQVLSLLPACSGLVKETAYLALGAMGSTAWRAELIRHLEASPSFPSPEEVPFIQELRGGLSGAKRSFPQDEEVRESVWRFAERWEVDNDVLYHAARYLLASTTPDDVERLVDVIVRKQYHFVVEKIKIMTAFSAFVERLMPFPLFWFDGLLQDLVERRSEFPDLLSGIFEVDIPFSYPFRSRFGAHYFSDRAFVRNVLKAAEDEMRQVAARRGDDLDKWLTEWQAGQLTDGYRWRAAFSYHLIRVLRQHVPASFLKSSAMCVTGLLALSTYLLDDDRDEHLPDIPDAQERLLAIRDLILSDRPFVPQPLMDEFQAKGPEVLDDLWDEIDKSETWPSSLARLRVLDITAKLACHHPGCADDRVIWLLEWADASGLEFIEAQKVLDTLVQIGPGAVPELIKWVEGTEEEIFLIWGIEALSRIPTELSLETLLEVGRRFVDGQKIRQARIYATMLNNFPHPRALPLINRLIKMLQERHAATEDEEKQKELEQALDQLAKALCLIAALHGVPVPNYEEWRERAVQLVGQQQEVEDFYKNRALEETE